MAVPKPVKKTLWESAAGFVKKAYGSGMTRDETVLRGLVGGRYEARKGLKEARTALEAAERAPEAAVAEAFAKGDAKIEAFNKGMSDMNKDALADLWHTGDEHAYDVARAQMEIHRSTEGAKTLAEVERLAKAGEEEAARLAEKIPGAREAFTAAERRFNDSVALVQQRRDLEASWFGFTKNKKSALWGPGQLWGSGPEPYLAPASPRMDVMSQPGHYLAKAFVEGGRQLSGNGYLQRGVSRTARYAARQIIPVSAEGKFGRVFDIVSAPGTLGVATTGLGLYVGGGYVGRKMGWLPPSVEQQYVDAQNALDAAVKSGDRSAIEKASKAYEDLKSKHPREENPPTVEQAVTRHTLASVAQDYAKTGDAAKRDEVLATMDPEQLKGQLGEIRRQVFSFHNPGRSIDQFEKSEAGRKFVAEFDRDVFGSKSGNDWLTTNLDAYQRELEAATAGEGN